MSSAATLEGVLSEIRKMREEQSSALANLNAAPAPASSSSHTGTPRRAKAAKGCSKGTVAAVLAAALAIVAAVFPSLYEMCPAMRAPPTASPAPASVAAAAARSSDAAVAELAAHKRNAVFLNAVAIDYFPFSSFYPDFTVKRLISATIHQIRAFPRACVFSAAEFIDWMRPTLDGGDRLLRRGLVHVEAVFLPLTGAAPVLASAASALSAFQTYQRALERYNPACHVHKLEPSRLDDDNAVAHLHLYHCNSEFLTMPAARVGTKDCRVKHWPNAPLSSFCRTGRDAVSAGGDAASHIPGFTSASDEEEELEHDTNQILDVLALPRRERPSSLVMPPDDEIPESMCQNLTTSAYQHTVLESMVAAPFFEHLSPQSTFQVLSVDPPVFLIEDFLTEDEVLHLHGLQDETMAPSGAVGASLKDSRHYRSSSTQFLDESGTPGANITACMVDTKIHCAVLERIEERALGLTGAPYIEELQLVRYMDNQTYEDHFDYFAPLTGSAVAIGDHGQRTATMFAYLSNDLPVAAEGETHFPELQTLKVRPRRRAAVLWFNTLPNGAEDERLLHGGLHVIGNWTKLAMNVWLRDPVLVGPLIPCSESLGDGKADGKAGTSGTA